MMQYRVLWYHRIAAAIHKDTPVGCINNYVVTVSTVCEEHCVLLLETYVPVGGGLGDVTATTGRMQQYH